MTKTQYAIIQFHAAVSILGYWCIHSILGIVSSSVNSTTSILYDGFQLMLSLYVIFICRNNMQIGRHCSTLLFYMFLLFLYLIRVFIDMVDGPFSLILPTSIFMNDMFRFIGTFTAAWAMIASWKYLNLQKIANYVFWIGFVTIICVRAKLVSMGLIDAYLEERMDAGRGLGTLALVKLSAAEVCASIHLLVSRYKTGIPHKILYILGIIIGLWLNLASGSRGGVVGLVLALGFYWIFSSRRHIFLNVLSLTSIVLIIVYVVPILEWLSHFFPIMSNRMLLTLLENDQSGRELIRQQAWTLILEHPILGYSYRLLPTPTGYGAHNGILNITLALGIPIGFLFIYFVYLKVIIMSIRLTGNNSNLFAVTMAIFALVISISGSGVADSCFNFSIILLAATYYNERFMGTQYIEHVYYH